MILCILDVIFHQKKGSAKQFQTKFRYLSPNTGFIHQLLWTSAGFEGYRSASGATDTRWSSRLGSRFTAARQPVAVSMTSGCIQMSSSGPTSTWSEAGISHGWECVGHDAWEIVGWCWMLPTFSVCLEEIVRKLETAAAGPLGRERWSGEAMGWVAGGRHESRCSAVLVSSENVRKVEEPYCWM